MGKGVEKEMNPIKVLIVDDNLDSQEILQFFVEQLPDFKIIGICNDGEQLVESVMMHKPDLILADINMPKKDGVQAIKECLLFNKELKFIFITGYDDYAVEAFNLSAIDYVVKPVEKARLYVALEKAKQVIGQSHHHTIIDKPDKSSLLPIKFNGSIFYVPLNDILFIEKSGKKCMIYTTTSIFETYENISELQTQLSNNFFQTHRSYIVNLKKISHITPKNETFLVYFPNSDKYAHVSRLKINELQGKMKEIK